MMTSLRHGFQSALRLSRRNPGYVGPHRYHPRPWNRGDDGGPQRSLERALQPSPGRR